MQITRFHLIHMHICVYGIFHLLMTIGFYWTGCWARQGFFSRS